jgi:hypothetical protein
MEDPHSAVLNGSNSRSTISSLLNDDASTDAQEVDHFASYGSPFLPELGSSVPFNDPVVIDVDLQQPPNKRKRQSIDAESAPNDFKAPHAGEGHEQLSFPSLHLHPLGASASAENPQALPSPSLLTPAGQLDSHVVEEERRALAEERRKVAADRQQLDDDRRAFEDEKRQFYDEKQKWLDEREKQQTQTSTAGGGKPTLSFGRRAQAQLEEQSFGCVFVKNNAIVTKPSPNFAQAFVVLSDMMTQKQVELPLAIGIGAKDTSLPKKSVQDLGCILIPQQTRDYGPSYAKTGYLVVTLKDQKGGAPVRIEAVEGNESDVCENYFIIAKSDLSLLRCIANEKEGTISNDHAGAGGGETTEAAKGKRKK